VSHPSSLPPWRLFWAKTDRSGQRPEWTRPLWAHLIDVANAANVVWDRMVPAALKSRLATASGLSVEDTGRWFSLQIGLHDWGKAIPSFQQWHKQTCERLAEHGLTFPDEYNAHNSIHHGHATIQLAWRRLSRQETPPALRSTLEGLAAMVGFHHGKLAPGTKLREGDMFGPNLHAILGQEETWGKAQSELYEAVVAAWNPTEPSLQGEGRRWPTWIMGVGGWCTLADWLGSMNEHYPDDVSHGDDLEPYIERSRAGAESAYSAAGLDNRAALLAKPFAEIFKRDDGTTVEPRPLQKECITLPIAGTATPTLTIIEAPTGEGKTEAALILAARQQAGGGSGIYVAMPSQATSNGLFLRFADFLRHAHDKEHGAVNLVLVHGSSALNKEQEQLVRVFLDARRQFSPIYSNDDTAAADRARVETADWFLPKKRSLLAPYGIGTVDQALLGVLYAKHFFLRLFGLSGKTVIFDEVHAYDTYMNVLFGRLLAWLREAGAHVIVLSATLPTSTRRAIEAAWRNDDNQPAAAEPSAPPYPALWHSTATTPSEPVSFEAQLGQKAVLDWDDANLLTIARRVVEAARNGAAVAAIVNTVARAQELYRLVREGLHETSIEPILFHARFPFGRKAEIERTVLERFGKRRTSCTPGVLIATQVAEQSLDLDVDLMLSDLAPVDLLLQRAGRLHRHRHHARPPGCEQPRLVVLYPLTEEEGEIPDFKLISGSGYIYHHAVLLRTWHLLRGRTGWDLPHDYRPLIEGVYSRLSAPPPDGISEHAQAVWRAEQDDFHNTTIKHRGEAQQRMIPPPHELKNIITARHLELTDEDEADPNLHEHYRALTRLGDLTVEAACLHRGPDGTLYLDPELNLPLPRTLPLGRASLRAIQECVVKLSGKRLISLMYDMVDPDWDRLAKETPGLDRVRPLVFERTPMPWGETLYWQGSRGAIEYCNERGIIYHQSIKETNADGELRPAV